MADALASALISTIVTNVNTRALRELGFLAGLETELDNLSRAFNTIQEVLHDAELKQWSRGEEGKAVKTWLRLLKDAAYDADDVLDEFDLKVQRRQQQKGLKNHVRSCFSLHHNPIAFRVEMAHKLKSAREKLDAIYERSRPLRLQVGSTSSPQGVLESRLTTSLVNDSEICGSDDQKVELINDLVFSSEALSVHALCGIGGLGKTTLAQLVCNAETIKTHFEKIMWVCVSDDTDIKRLTRAIIESIGGVTSSNELDSLQRLLLEMLAGKKFLLVLDDVWDDFLDKWDRSKNAIRSGAIGSVVLITTRIQRVAEKMATVPIRPMGRLSDDDSWSLFALHAFSKRKTEEHERFKTFRERIVKKCGGVPLVLKVLGSLMQEKQEEKEWLYIVESELWDLGDEGKKILAILRLSYTHLPINLRQCFSYCCIYPKDYVMEKNELIQIWMSNGFISCRGRKDLHETGNEIFRELVARSFFQNVEMDFLGNTTCKMHDLLHDVATSVMEHEVHLIQPGGSLDGVKNCRHVSYYPEVTCFPLKATPKFPSLPLRSFFYTKEHAWLINYSKDVVEWLSSQKHLRILRLDCPDVEKLPMSLSKHLSYLDVSRSSIKRLPESTSSLHRLQTLNLRFCRHLKQLPKGMKEMKSLVYLDIRGCYRLKRMPPGIGQLKGMRKLSKFIVGKKDGCKIGELKELNGLEGELSISGLCNVKSVADFKSANLMEKKMLTSLELIAGIRRFEGNSHIDVEALSDLQPYQNLRKLLISGYGSLELPHWMKFLHVHLPNLVEITLTGFSQCQQLPIPLGRLDSLKVLELWEMSCLEHIGVEVYGDGERAAFPSLEKLTLYNMRSLKEWAEITTSASSSRAAMPFPCLRELKIFRCPLLTKFPIIPSVQDLSIRESTITTSQLELPHWMKFLHVHLPNLVEIKLTKFSQCQQLPIPLGRLDSLKVIELREMSCLEHIGVEVYGDGERAAFPSLEKLTLDEMRSLKEWAEITTSASSSRAALPFPCLRELSIRHCPSLTKFPIIPSVQDLSIWESTITTSQLTVLVQANFIGLRSLSLDNFDQLESLPELGPQHNVCSLESFDISSCDKLQSLPSTGLWCSSSLRGLEIRCCDELITLSDDGLRHLTALQELTLGNCPKMTSLPESIQHLTVLQKLSIWKCERLSCLPDGIKSLTILATLDIFGCPDLGRRCEKDKGEDWPKIAHIPNIRIDWKQIQGSFY